MLARFWRSYAHFAHMVQRTGLPRPPFGKTTLGHFADSLIRRVLTRVSTGLSVDWESCEIAFGDYEPATTRAILSLLEPGMTFVDIGAHVGYYTVLGAQRVGITGRIYAFEPANQNLHHLKINTEKFTQVEIIPVAVSDVSGSASLYLDHGVTHSLMIRHQRSVNVPTVTLDDFFNSRGWPRVDVVKMDIEGGELRALRGGAQFFGRFPSSALIVEYNPPLLGAESSELLAILRDFGFTYRFLPDQPLNLICTR